MGEGHTRKGSFQPSVDVKLLFEIKDFKIQNIWSCLLGVGLLMG